MVCKNFPGDTAATKNICILFFLAVRCPCVALCAFLRLFVAICAAAFVGAVCSALPALSEWPVLDPSAASFGCLSAPLCDAAAGVALCRDLLEALPDPVGVPPGISSSSSPLSLFPDLPCLSLFLSGGALPFALSLPLCCSLFPVRVLLASLPFCPSLCPPALLCCVNLADTPSASR